MMNAEADQLCGGANNRNGYRERALATSVGRIVSQVFRGRGHVRAGRDVAGVQVLLGARERALRRGRRCGIAGAVDWARLEADARKIIESGLELAGRVEASIGY